MQILKSINGLLLSASRALEDLAPSLLVVSDITNRLVDIEADLPKTMAMPATIVLVIVLKHGEIEFRTDHQVIRAILTYTTNGQEQDIRQVDAKGIRRYVGV